MAMEAQLTLSEDCLRATIDIPGGYHLELQTLRQMVADEGIRFGLIPETLLEAAVVDDQDRQLTIARGKPAISHWRWRMRPEYVGELAVPVIKGQVIADKVHDETRDEQPGMTVTGNELPVNADEITDVQIDDTLDPKGDLLRAAKDGIFVTEHSYRWRVDDDPRGKPNKDPVLFIADDGLSSWVRLEAGQFIPTEVLQAKLKEKGIVFGLNPAGIQQATNGVQTAETVELAHGNAPENGKDGYLEYQLTSQIAYEMRSDGTVDFKAANPIQEVQEEQILAQIFPPTAGTLGMSVRGDLLDAKAGNEVNPQRYCGPGVYAVTIGKDIQIRSERDGVYNKLVNGKLQVRELLLIDGDVDMKTGHVETEFPIRITGDIKAGFTVKSSCDIQVDGSIEDARVSAQGNLQVKGGILPGQSRVKAHGDVHARFIEQREIKARSVLVISSLRHCTVYSTGEVVAQDIVGGQIVAAENINVVELGDEIEQATIVQAGVDPRSQAVFDKAVADKALIMPDMKRLQNAVLSAASNANTAAKKVSQLSGQSVAPKQLKRMAKEARDALSFSKERQAELENMQAQLIDIEAEIERYETAVSQSEKCTIQVSRVVHPNVEVRIGRHAKKHLQRGNGAAIFRLKEGLIVY